MDPKIEVSPIIGIKLDKFFPLKRNPLESPFDLGIEVRAFLTGTVDEVHCSISHHTNGRPYPSPYTDDN
jgi:hypothetical protein